jgi:hypothetical protein
LYPQVAVPDADNPRRRDSDLVFHTSRMPDVALHPGCVFAGAPHLIREGDVLFFGTLLETQRPFLTNVSSASALHVLSVVARRIDVNADATRWIVDGWLLLAVTDARAAAAALRLAHRVRLLVRAVLAARLPPSPGGLVASATTLAVAGVPADRDIALMPELLRAIGSDAVDVRMPAHEVMSELRQRLAAYLVTPIAFKVEQIRSSQRAANVRSTLNYSFPVRLAETMM